MLVRLLVILLCFGCGAQAQEGQEERTDVNPFEGRQQAIAAGRQLFLTGCAGCHGLHAEGGRGPNLADGHLTRDVSAKKLYDSIRRGVPGTTMPPFDLPEEKIWQLLAYVTSLSAPAFESPVPGDPEAGRLIFYGKAGCADCHTILGRGHFWGPDLSNIGMTRSLKQLHDALLEPASRSRVGYQGVVVTTRGGEVVNGILRNGTNYSLQVQDAQGRLHLLLMQDVRSLRYQPKSLMPADYERRLSNDEIDNLIAFLSRQALRPPKSRLASHTQE
jgi:cytochrome c oxidase cbb3-type subunit III